MKKRIIRKTLENMLVQICERTTRKLILDHNSEYGGYFIREIDNPLCSHGNRITDYKESATTMCEFLSGCLFGVCLNKK